MSIVTKPSGIPWLGELPALWEVKRLGYIADTLVPMRDKPESLDGEIPWIRIEDFTGKYIDGSKSGQGISQETVDAMHLKVYPPGTVLCSCSCSMGATAIVTRPLVSNQTFIGIVPSVDVHPDFLYYQLASNSEDLQSRATGAIQQYLSRDDFRQLRIPLPPLSEQRAIAAFLDERTARIDGLIARKLRLVQLLKEKRQALITRAVTRGLDAKVKLKESGVPWLGEVPEAWEVKRLKHISEFITSGSRGWAEHYADEGAVFIRIGNLDRTSIDLRLDDIQRVDPPTSAEVIRTRALPGDLLISITAFLGTIGLVPDGLGDAYVNQHTALIRLQHPVCHPRFVAYWFSSRAAQQQFESASQGGTKEGMNLQEVRDLITLQPNYEEQNRIADALDKSLGKIDALITKVEQAVLRLQEYRTALISAAVTGKVRVGNQL